MIDSSGLVMFIFSGTEVLETMYLVFPDAKTLDDTWNHRKEMLANWHRFIHFNPSYYTQFIPDLGINNFKNYWIGDIGLY